MPIIPFLLTSHRPLQNGNDSWSHLIQAQAEQKTQHPVSSSVLESLEQERPIKNDSSSLVPLLLGAFSKLHLQTPHAGSFCLHTGCLLVFRGRAGRQGWDRAW